MTPYLVTPAAVIDLDELADYLVGSAGREVALRFFAAASATFAAIVRMPGLGERWPTKHPRLAGLRVRRVDGFPAYLVLHRSTDAGIEVVRVLHAARDVDAALGDPG